LYFSTQFRAPNGVISIMEQVEFRLKKRINYELQIFFFVLAIQFGV